MADKRIQDLTPATSVQTSDRFVLEQSGQAKSLTGQILINDLAIALDGHGGISDISYTAPSSGDLDGTLTITLADETEETFTVTNGRGIVSITKTGTVDLVDEYTIAYNDDTSSVFYVTNGEKGDTGDADHVYIKWSATEPSSDADIGDVPDAWIGVATTTADTAPTSYTEYSWYEYKGETGDTGNGIVSVTLEVSSGLVDTYKVLFSDNTYTSFNVTNGSQIDSIEKTSTSGLTDTYTVTLTNGDTTTFEVVNGKGITSITAVDVTHAAGHTDVYRFNFNDGDSYTFSIYNGTNGSGSVSTVDEIPSDNQNVPLLLFGSGAPTTATVGELKQRYFDQTNSILYICTGIDTSGAETTYNWQGTGVTVDSVLSTMSTNPVQNAVLATIIGTGTPTTTAQNLVGAVNELDGEMGNDALTTTAQTAKGAINEVNLKVNDVINRTFQPLALTADDFELGGINQNGTKSSNQNRIRPVDFISTSTYTCFYVTLQADIRTSLTFYDSLQAYVGRTDWIHASQKIGIPSNAAYMKWQVASEDDSPALTVNDYYKCLITFCPPVQTGLNLLTTPTRACLISDSIGFGVCSIGNTGGVDDVPGQSWADALFGSLGIELKNLSARGMGYLVSGSSGTTIENVITEIGTLPKDYYNLFIVQLGINDYNTENIAVSGVDQKIKNVANAIQQRSGNARVIFFSPFNASNRGTSSANYDYGYSYSGRTLKDFCDQIETTCNSRGIEYHNVASNLLDVYSITKKLLDNVHPSQAFHFELAKIMSRYIGVF